VVIALVAALVPTVCQAQSRPPSDRPSFRGRDTPISAPLSATRLLAAAKEDALEAHWANVEIEARGTSMTGFYDEEVGPASGSQVLTVNGSVVMFATLVGNEGYIKGYEFFLRQLGLGPAEAAKVSGRWISVPSTNQMFQQLVGGLTMAGALDGTLPQPPLTLGATVKRGTTSEQLIEGRLPPAAGAGPGSANVWVTLGGHPLPVRASATFGNGTGPQTTFSKWGSLVRVTPPADAIPAASLGL